MSNVNNSRLKKQLMKYFKRILRNEPLSSSNSKPFSAMVFMRTQYPSIRYANCLFWYLDKHCRMTGDCPLWKVIFNWPKPTSRVSIVLILSNLASVICWKKFHNLVTLLALQRINTWKLSQKTSHQCIKTKVFQQKINKDKNCLRTKHKNHEKWCLQLDRLQFHRL